MSEIENGGLDQYGTGPFKQQQFGTAGVEGVKSFIAESVGLIDFSVYTVLVCTAVLLGRIALVAQRPIVVKLSRERSVGRSICLSSALWKNGGSDPDTVWHHRLDGCKDEAGSGVWGSVHGKGYFWG